MRKPGSPAFSMIEVAIAIAVIAILAGAVAPLALKALNQQREQKTRDNLKIAYEAIFGARDHRTSNMIADFNYTPSALTLSTMTIRPATIRAYASYTPTYPDLSGGWNGPYWTGSMNANGVPLDGWGRPFVFRNVGGGWQLLSLGANGVPNTPAANGTPQGDDLAYPVPSQPLPTASVSVNVCRVGGYSATNPTVSCVVPGPGATPTITSVSIVSGRGSASIHPGRAIVIASIDDQAAYPTGSPIIPATTGTQTLSQVVDILPGSSAIVNFTFQ